VLTCTRYQGVFAAWKPGSDFLFSCHHMPPHAIIMIIIIIIKTDDSSVPGAHLLCPNYRTEFAHDLSRGHRVTWRRPLRSQKRGKVDAREENRGLIRGKRITSAISKRNVWILLNRGLRLCSGSPDPPAAHPLESPRHLSSFPKERKTVASVHPLLKGCGLESRIPSPETRGAVLAVWRSPTRGMAYARALLSRGIRGNRPLCDYRLP
jgi:hypothetical protein